jgi:DNA repair protein RecO (recombination protein O)
MDDALALSMLTAACAVADNALPEREPHTTAFRALLRTLAGLADTASALPDLVRWEAALLADLGYGLDFSRCTVTGATTDLAYVSPRTGRAVAATAAGQWAARLLKLPAFLTADAPASHADIADGLRLTGHFLANVFALKNQALPAARLALLDRLA